MNKELLHKINLGIAALSLLLIGVGALIWLFSPRQLQEVEVVSDQKELPQNPFRQEEEEYEALSNGFLSLKFSPMSMQLPDLKRYLTYYGRNDRPDADPGKALIHFSFTGSDKTASTPPGKPLYLLYDKNQARGSYIFSPDNQETSLWIEAAPAGEDAKITVTMKNDRGELIREPKSYSEFTLKERRFGRGRDSSWKIGEYRADSTLLSRQKARWYGQDLFFLRHGGEEYNEQANKQRIDFQADENPYSIYVAPGDLVIWKEGRWEVAGPDEKTRSYPLLTVKQVEDRLMKLELWSPEGESKVSLNLIKSTQTWAPKAIEKQFKFVGTRTRSQFVFDVDGKRMILSPKDWLLKTDRGWKKLRTVEEIDNYVNRETTGVLFVFDAIGQKDGKQVAEVTLFNPARTSMEKIEIPIQQGGISPSGKPSEATEEEDEDDDEEGGAVDPDSPEAAERRKLWEERRQQLEELRERGDFPEDLDKMFDGFRGRRGHGR